MMGTESCDSVDPQLYHANDVKIKMYLTSLTPSFCILLSNRNVAYSISLNGILSLCMSCELLLHGYHRCAVITTLINLPKGGDLCLQHVCC